jgi:hypothetical protein
LNSAPITSTTARPLWDVSIADRLLNGALGARFAAQFRNQRTAWRLELVDH